MSTNSSCIGEIILLIKTQLCVQQFGSRSGPTDVWSDLGPICLHEISAVTSVGKELKKMMAAVVRKAFLQYQSTIRALESVLDKSRVT